jgi:hypothetical protein
MSQPSQDGCKCKGNEKEFKTRKEELKEEMKTDEVEIKATVSAILQEMKFW